MVFSDRLLSYSKKKKKKTGKLANMTTPCHLSTFAVPIAVTPTTQCHFLSITAIYCYSMSRDVSPIYLFIDDL